MNKICIFAVGVLAAAVLPAAAQSHSYKGTWKLDVAQSDFGAVPKPKSETLVISEDTPQRLAWHITRVSASGKVAHTPWSGPEGGSMHPMQPAALKVQMGFKEEGSAVVIHETDGEGTTIESHVTLSDDGKTMTEDETDKTKDGKDTKAKYVFHRA